MSKHLIRADASWEGLGGTGMSIVQARRSQARDSHHSKSSAPNWRFADRDLFLTFPDAEMPDKPSAVRFVIGPDGKASSVTIEFLDEHKLGTLQRVGD